MPVSDEARTIAKTPDKQFCQMTMEELLEERAYWQEKIDKAQTWGASYALAEQMRNGCAQWIERRERQAQKDPDT
jgi:hypothetical protein